MGRRLRRGKKPEESRLKVGKVEDFASGVFLVLCLTKANSFYIGQYSCL